MTTARAAAYFALLDYAKQGTFLKDSLSEWLKSERPPLQELRLAQEIAYGTMRMQRSLDAIARQLVAPNPLKLKPKELILLRTALYQHYYMDRVPLYAIVDQTLKIASQHLHASVKKFLHAVLGKIKNKEISLPDEWGVRYSYPTYYIDLLRRTYPQKLETILTAGNLPGITMVRLRNDPDPLTVQPVPADQSVPEIAASEAYYIQNITPVTLIKHLCRSLEAKPKKILDLCASPGGKLIAMHDKFPHAELFANDVSKEKLKRIEENLQKYHVNAQLFCGTGEALQTDERFDVILIDAPCSNTGVLNKRPEARWRLDSDHLNELLETQRRLINHSVELLAPKGEIWYLTCSILPEENEQQVDWAVKQFGLKLKYSQTILPNAEGWDGGFGAALKK